MSQPASSPLLDALLQAPLPASGIAWLDASRQASQAALAEAGLPDTRVEAWKYTALRALGQKPFADGDAGAGSRELDASAWALPGVDGPRLVFVNGVFRADLSAFDGLPDGLSLQPLSQALQEDAGSLQPVLSPVGLTDPRHPSADAFALANAARARDGVVLRVAAGARVETSVQLVFAGAAGDSELAWHARVLVSLGEGAALTLVEQHVGSHGQSQLATTMADFTLAANAELKHVVLQQAGTASNLIRRSRLHLHEKAQAALHVLELGGALVRHDLQVELTGDGAQLQTRGVFMPQGRQHIDTQLAIRHQALNTVSNSQWRGVAADRARGVFRGAIVVAPGADGTDASLNNKNLLLSASAEIDTKPELEIYADEVQAAHGATVGQLDERSLFYLRSRGIPLAEARALLTGAFCRAMLDSLPNDALREHLAGLLVAQLPG